MQQPRPRNRALLFGLQALLLLVVAGGGLFLLLNGTPKPASNAGPSGPNTTQITPTPNAAQASPVKAEASERH